MKTPTLKKTLARKAVKSTAKHTAHGLASKVKREPMRAVTLLGAGFLAGNLAARLAGRAHTHNGSYVHEH